MYKCHGNLLTTPEVTVNDDSRKVTDIEDDPFNTDFPRGNCDTG